MFYVAKKGSEVFEGKLYLTEFLFLESLAHVVSEVLKVGILADVLTLTMFLSSFLFEKIFFRLELIASFRVSNDREYCFSIVFDTDYSSFQLEGLKRDSIAIGLGD